MTEEMNKAERLAVAGYVAPRMRGDSERTASRRVARVDKDGKVVGYTTLAEVQKALLRARAIEIEVVDGTRPDEAICERCGLPAKVRARARVEGGTIRCDKCTFLSCPDCKKPLPRCYSAPSMMAKGDGEKVCRPCRAKRTKAALPVCSGCAKRLSRNSEWQYRKNNGPDMPLRCAACSRDARRLSCPTCAVCSKQLHASARYRARTKSGKPPMCSDCYTGDARAEVARAKMADDPAFAMKVKRVTCRGADRALSDIRGQRNEHGVQHDRREESAPSVSDAKGGK